MKAPEIIDLALEAANRIQIVQHELSEERLRTRELLNTNGRLRYALRDAISNMDPEAFRDYEQWKALSEGRLS